MHKTIMSLEIEREIEGDDGVNYVALVEVGMEPSLRQPGGELMVHVTITNWMPPVWTASMSLRSSQGPATDVDKTLRWIKESVTGPDVKLVLRDDQNEPHMMGSFYYGAPHAVRLPPPGSGLLKLNESESQQRIQDLGMRMLRQLQKTGKELSESQSQWAAERMGREATVAALESSLKKLRDEHMVAKAKLDMFEGRSSRPSPAKKQKGSGGSNNLVNIGGILDPFGMAPSSMVAGSVAADASNGHLHAVPAGSSLLDGDFPSGSQQIPSLSGALTESAAVSGLSALPAVIVHGTGGRGGRGGRGRSGGRTKLG